MKAGEGVGRARKDYNNIDHMGQKFIEVTKNYNYKFRFNEVY